MGVAWIPLVRAAVSVGDLVSAEAGGMPIYRVVGLENGQALVEDEQRTAVRRMALDRFHWKAAAESRGH